MKLDELTFVFFCSINDFFSYLQIVWTDKLDTVSRLHTNSRCKLSKMQACISVSNHMVSSRVWHTVSHTCVLFKLLYFVHSIQYCTRVQNLYCKPRMSSMTRKKSYYPDVTGSFFQEGWYPRLEDVLPLSDSL